VVTVYDPCFAGLVNSNDEKNTYTSGTRNIDSKTACMCDVIDVENVGYPLTTTKKKHCALKAVSIIHMKEIKFENERTYSYTVG
jgi:hypothetical protein